MTITESSVGASSPEGRMFRLDLGGVDGYAAGDFVTIAEDSGGRHLGLVEWLDQHEGGGEALVAGGFVPAPSIIKFRDRITHEGGIDVSVPMPTP